MLSVGQALRESRRDEFVAKYFTKETWPSVQSEHSNFYKTLFMTDRHVQVILDAWDRSGLTGVELARQSGASVELLKVAVKRRKISLYTGGKLALALGDFL